MAHVKVANPKNYALTQGKPYEVLERDDNRVKVVNDHNVQAWYSKKLFFNGGKNLSDAQLQQALEENDMAPVAPAVPAFPDVNQVLEGLNYNIDAGRLEFTVGDNAHTVPIQLGNSSTEVSGAMRQIFKINDFYEALTEYLEENVEGADAAWRAAFVDGAFSKGVKALMANVQDTVKYFMVSTNENYASFNRINGVLTPLTVASDVSVNPQTGNNIKVWLLRQQQ